MSQFALPLVWPKADGDGFIVGTANAEAVAHLNDHARWPVPVALLVGPPRSGRSLLARRFARQLPQARVIDDAEQAEEEALFHAWNGATAAAPLLLVVGNAWTPVLPDLASRLAATPRAVIAAPDDALLAALIEKGLVERGLPATRSIVGLVADGIERSYLALAAAIQALDRTALSAGRLTLPLARAALASVIDDS